MAEPAAPALFEQLARGWRAYALLALIALMAALPGVGRMPVLDRDEARFAQATRQMLETGDFVRIRVQETDRNKKPIGIHWLQAVAVTVTEPLTGGLNQIWAYRLPSVLGAILATLAAFWAGTALLDRRAAFIGAALLASCALLSGEAMIAKTDAMMTGLTTLALAALAQLYARSSPPAHSPQGREGKWIVLLFWAAIGAGILIKGPVTPAVAALTLGALALWERRVFWMKPLLWWPGPVLAALIVAPWMLAINIATDGAFFLDAIARDMGPKLAGGQEGHFAWPTYHLALLPILIFPATFALPAAARLAWRSVRSPRAGPDPLRFLIAWAAPTFLLFELIPTKLVHYTLPTYPAIALICGAALFAMPRARWTNIAGIALFVLGGAAWVAITAYTATYMPGDAAADLRRAIQGALIGAGVVGAAAVALALAPLPLYRTGAGVLAALVLAFMFRQHVLPEARALHVSAEAVAALTRERLTPRDDRALWVVGYNETSLVFLTRTDVHMTTPVNAGEHAAVGEIMLIESRGLAETEAELAARHLVFARKGAPVSGFNYSNSDRVDLYLGEVASAPSEND
jgi:4-amino-4-deoxy-L-arabinose transferase-like glycosyltransferase